MAANYAKATKHSNNSPLNPFADRVFFAANSPAPVLIRLSLHLLW